MRTTNKVHPLTKIQQQIWDKFSTGWEKWDQKIQEISNSVTRKMIDEAQLTDSDNILDVSSGTGEPGLTAAMQAKHVTATDVSEEMLEVAQKSAKKRGLSNFEVEAADAENLPYSDSQFDVVLCRYGVMFFANPDAGVREMARVLKPRGRILLASWSEPFKNPFFTVAAATINKVLATPQPQIDSPGVFRHSRPGQLTELLEQANLEDVREIEISGEAIFNSPDEYWQFMTEVAPPILAPLNDASDEMRSKAKEAVMEATKPYQKDGKLILPWASWIAIGHK